MQFPPLHQEYSKFAFQVQSSQMVETAMQVQYTQSFPSAYDSDLPYKPRLQNQLKLRIVQIDKTHKAFLIGKERVELRELF